MNTGNDNKKSDHKKTIKISPELFKVQSSKQTRKHGVT
jgi:hypothetical protein